MSYTIKFDTAAMSEFKSYNPLYMKHWSKRLRPACAYCKAKKIKVCKRFKGADELAHLNIAMASAIDMAMRVLQYACNARTVVSIACYRGVAVTAYRLDGIPQL